jgi:hypothetical protein
VTAGLSYRYILSAVPAVCLAAGLAFAGRGSLLTWLREHGFLGSKTPHEAEPAEELSEGAG